MPNEETRHKTGFFTKPGEYGRTSLRAGRIATTATASVLALATAWSSIYINNQTEKSLEVTLGKVTQQVDSAGPHLKVPFLSKRFAISTAQKTVSIAEDTKLRTGDDIRFKAGFDIEIQIRENADITRYYNDLKGYDGDVMKMAETRAKDATVRAIESLTIQDLVPPIDAEGNPISNDSFTTKMTSKVKEFLQTEFDNGEWGIKVKGVYSKGFELDPKSEEKLAEIVALRQEAVKLVFRKANAIEAKAVFTAEAEADVAYLDEFKAAGITNDGALATIHCLKTARDAANINGQFTPGCIGSSEGVTPAVTVSHGANAAGALPVPQVQ